MWCPWPWVHALGVYFCGLGPRSRLSLTVWGPVHSGALVWEIGQTVLEALIAGSGACAEEDIEGREAD